MDEFALTISVSSETLLDQLPAATWTVDPDLRLTSWNGGGLVPPGAAPDIRPGQSVTAILHAYGIDSAAIAFTLPAPAFTNPSPTSGCAEY